MSLLSGLAFGLIACFGAYQSSNNFKNFHVALIASLILFLVMGSRYYNSGKVMPAGFMCVLSFFQTIRLGLRYLN